MWTANVAECLCARARADDTVSKGMLMTARSSLTSQDYNHVVANNLLSSSDKSVPEAIPEQFNKDATDMTFLSIPSSAAWQ